MLPPQFRRRTLQVQLEKAPAGYAGVLIQTSHIHDDDDEAFDIIGQAMHSPVINIEYYAEGAHVWSPCCLMMPNACALLPVRRAPPCTKEGVRALMAAIG